MTDRDATDLLIARYLDGTAQPQDIAELDRLLCEDPALRRALLQAGSLDAMIRVSLAESAIIRMPARPGSPRTPEPGKPVHHARRRPWAWAASAAAVLAVCLGVWAWSGQPAPGVAVVQSSRGETVNVATSAPLKVGTILFPGDQLRVGSEASLRIAMIDGSSFSFGPGSTLALPATPTASSQAIRLMHGSLRGWVKPQLEPKQLIFLTPHGQATPMGAILDLEVDAQRTSLHVEDGMVAFATSGQSLQVTAGMTAIAQDGRLSLITKPSPAPAPVPAAHAPAPAQVAGYGNGRLLFADDFTHGLAPNWVAYAGSMRSPQTVRFAPAIPGIRLVSVERNGASTGAVQISVRPGDEHIGIQMTSDEMPAVPAFSLEYAYSYDGPQRKAMQGLMIFTDKPFEQDALPAGSWNTVRWECLPGIAHDGTPCLNTTLIFNGSTILTRQDRVYLPGLLLEVSDGTLRFTGVVIRELVAPAAPPSQAF